MLADRQTDTVITILRSSIGGGVMTVISDIPVTCSQKLGSFAQYSKLLRDIGCMVIAVLMEHF